MSLLITKAIITASGRTAQQVRILSKALLLTAGADPERLFRLLRFATVHGIFNVARQSGKRQGPDTTAYRNNALSACLREDHPNSQKHLVRAAVPELGRICHLMMTLAKPVVVVVLLM